jgi:hypothetical protein
MYLCRATTLASEQPPGVTAEGGANVYGAFGLVCSIFPVLLFRGFQYNVPPRPGSSTCGSSKFEPPAGPLKLFFRVGF